MVSNLKYKRQDPNFGRGPTKYRVQKNRGAGYYYHRGNNQWSKYDEGLDGQQWHKRTKVKNKEKAEKKQPHKGDYKTMTTKARSRKTKRVPSSRRRGFF